MLIYNTVIIVLEVKFSLLKGKQPWIFNICENIGEGSVVDTVYYSEIQVAVFAPGGVC